jgi:hypothetical protein
VLGWAVAFLGAIVVTAGLCLLTTGHHTLVGVGYAAGVACGAAVTSAILSGVGNDWGGPLAQFAVVFLILAAVSLLGSVPCTILKWEDRKARGAKQRGEADGSHAR